MLFRATMFCKVRQVEIHEWRAKTGYKDFLFEPRCHGSLYIKVSGTLCEEKAAFVMKLNIEHRCHTAHQKRREEECACRAVHSELRRLDWKGLRPDKDSRTLRIEVVGGEGEILEWYPMGTKFKEGNFNHQHHNSDHPQCKNVSYLFDQEI